MVPTASTMLEQQHVWLALNSMTVSIVVAVAFHRLCYHHQKSRMMFAGSRVADNNLPDLLVVMAVVDPYNVLVVADDNIDHELVVGIILTNLVSIGLAYVDH